MKRILIAIAAAIAGYGCYLIGYLIGLEHELVEVEEPLEEFPAEVNRWRMNEELSRILAGEPM